MLILSVVQLLPPNPWRCTFTLYFCTCTKHLIHPYFSPLALSLAAAPRWWFCFRSLHGVLKEKRDDIPMFELLTHLDVCWGFEVKCVGDQSTATSTTETITGLMLLQTHAAMSQPSHPCIKSAERSLILPVCRGCLLLLGCCWTLITYQVAVAEAQFVPPLPHKLLVLHDNWSVWRKWRGESGKHGLEMTSSWRYCTSQRKPRSLSC